LILKGEVKMKKQLFVLLAGLMALSILAAPVAAGTIRTEYAGFEHYVGPVSPGRVWVSEDGVLHIRGAQSAWRDVVSDPRVSGDVLLTLNANLKFAAPPVMFYGRMWGTARLSNDGGYWEGSFVAERTESQGFSYGSIVLHGHGAYEGLQARADIVRESPDPSAPFSIHGFVMEPGGE
jgi:hypothetical protein